jgi:hypothetical protein
MKTQHKDTKDTKKFFGRVHADFPEIVFASFVLFVFVLSSIPLLKN